MQHLVNQPPVSYFSRTHSRHTSCVYLSILAFFLQTHPPEWRTDHYICLLGVCTEYHSQFLPQNIQILTTVSCSRFIHGRHWQLRRFFLFIWQFDPCFCHLVLPPQEAECLGNAEIKEQSAIKHLSELWTVEMVLKWPCTLEILKFINYSIDANSSKWCCCFRVWKKSRHLNSIRWLPHFRSTRA